MPFVEKSYEVLRGTRRLSHGDADTAALAGQLMRHREQQQQQQQQQVVSVILSEVTPKVNELSSIMVNLFL